MKAKELMIWGIALLMLTGCYSQNESGIEQNFMVVKTNGDTLRLKAKNWRWDWSHSVVFMSDNGSQYVSDVKDILKEEED